jgi:hypothetical protein
MYYMYYMYYYTLHMTAKKIDVTQCMFGIWKRHKNEHMMAPFETHLVCR